MKYVLLVLIYSTFCTGILFPFAETEGTDSSSKTNNTSGIKLKKTDTGTQKISGSDKPNFDEKVRTFFNMREEELADYIKINVTDKINSASDLAVTNYIWQVISAAGNEINLSTIEQAGYFNAALLFIDGSGNAAYTNQSGFGNITDAVINNGMNYLLVLQHGNWNYGRITQNGFENNLRIIQIDN